MEGLGILALARLHSTTHLSHKTYSSTLLDLLHRTGSNSPLDLHYAGLAVAHSWTHTTQDWQ